MLLIFIFVIAALLQRLGIIVFIQYLYHSIKAVSSNKPIGKMPMGLNLVLSAIYRTKCHQHITILNKGFMRNMLSVSHENKLANNMCFNISAAVTKTSEKCLFGRQHIFYFIPPGRYIAKYFGTNGFELNSHITHRRGRQ